MAAHPAIVSTVRDAGAVLDSFIQYHLAIGIERIFLFFDDPEDPFIDKLANETRVVAIPHNEALRTRWQQLRSRAKMEPHINSEVMARQTLNCELAISMADTSGCDWILHIDSDEALFCASGSAVELFQQLNDNGFDEVVFMNFEALPEAPEVNDYFRNVSLFKVNPMLKGQRRFSQAQVQMIRNARFSGEGSLSFNLYDNGKSAGRIDEYLIPHDVHTFTRRAPTGLMPSNSAICGDHAIILHYPNCGMENFVQKYKRLGKFDDKWFGVSDVLPFHRQARNVCATSDDATIRRFYRDRVMLHADEDVDRLLNNGILARIRGPADLLRNLARN